MDSLNNTTHNLLQGDETPQSSAKTHTTTIERKLKRAVSLNQKRKNRKLRPWKQWLAQTARIKYTLPPTKPEESSYNLQNLFHISSDILSPITSRQQSFNLNIFNMPKAQRAKIEEQMKSQVSSSIKVEILNVTAKQVVEKKEFPKSEEIIVISDSESENEDTGLRSNKNKALPIIDKGFYQETCTFMPGQFSAKNTMQSLHGDGQQCSKVEMITMPPMQKTKTLEYLRSQTTSSVKVEVVNPAPTQSAVVEIVGNEGRPPKQEDKENEFKDLTKLQKLENNTISNEKALIPSVSKRCETCENIISKHQNITVKIYHPPTETNLIAQGSNIIKFEIITSPQEKGISTEDNDIMGIIDSHQELQNPAICANHMSTESTTTTNTSTTSDSTPKASIINTQLASTLTKEEAKSPPNKLKMSVSNCNDSVVENASNNQNSETDFAKENSTKTLQSNPDRKPLSFKQIAKLLRKPSEIPTQTSKTQKINVNATLSQNSSTTTKSITSKSGYPTLRQRQMELHRLRVQVEQKRLELLDLKLAREWHEMERSKSEFEKNLKRVEAITLDDCIDI